MKTNYGVLISVLIIVCCITSCSPNDSITYGNPDDPNLVYSEQAYPGSTGEIVQITMSGETITCEKINEEYIFQGDILLQSPTKGAVYAEGNLWPDNIVYYTINSNLPNKERVIQAIEYYHTNTNLTFIQRTNQPNYIEFVYDADGCSSYLGMIGGRQPIRLADWGIKGNVIHEIGHAIGLLHEHSKVGRDQYVTINEENIEEGKLHNFIEYKSSNPNTDGFDFESIMLYSSYAFSKNGQPTIVKKNAQVFTNQRLRMSEDDLEIVNQLYPPLDGYTEEQRFIIRTISGTYESDVSTEDNFFVKMRFSFTEQYPSSIQRTLDMGDSGEQNVTLHGEGVLEEIFNECMSLNIGFYYYISEDGESFTLFMRDNDEEIYMSQIFLLDDVSANNFRISPVEDDTYWLIFNKVTDSNIDELTEAQINVLELFEGEYNIFEKGEIAGHLSFIETYDEPREFIAEGVKLTYHGVAEMNILNDDEEALYIGFYIWKDGDMVSMFVLDEDEPLLALFPIAMDFEILSPTSFKIKEFSESEWLTFSKVPDNPDGYTQEQISVLQKLNGAYVSVSNDETLYLTMLEVYDQPRDVDIDFGESGIQNKTVHGKVQFDLDVSSISGDEQLEGISYTYQSYISDSSDGERITYYMLGNEDEIETVVDVEFLTETSFRVRSINTSDWITFEPVVNFTPQQTAVLQKLDGTFSYRSGDDILRLSFIEKYDPPKRIALVEDETVSIISHGKVRMASDMAFINIYIYVWKDGSLIYLFDKDQEMLELYEIDFISETSFRLKEFSESEWITFTKE